MTPDEEIVDANAFNGAYIITSYNFNELVTFAPNDSYDGMYGAPKTGDITLKYYTESSNLKLDSQEGGVDIAYRSLVPTDIDDLRGDDAVQVIDGPGGQIRYMVFNFDTMPFGAQTADADPAKALAVRQAVADVVDQASSPTRSTRRAPSCLPAVLHPEWRQRRDPGVRGAVRRRIGSTGREQGQGGARGHLISSVELEHPVQPGKAPGRRRPTSRGAHEEEQLDNETVHQ